MTQTSTIKIQGKNLRLFLLLLSNNLPRNTASATMENIINAIPYQSIDDHIIHRTPHQTKVVKFNVIKKLSLFNIAYINEAISNTNTIIRTNPISV